MQFDKETAEVGEDVNLSIQANPGSTVYILTEDERNRLLGTSNDIFLYQVNMTFNCVQFGLISTNNMNLHIRI